MAAKKSAAERRLTFQDRFRRRAPLVFLSAFVLAESAPALNHVFSPVIDDALMAAERSPKIAYEFAVSNQGVIRAECRDGESRIQVIPEETIHTADGSFRKLAMHAALCTDFGFKKHDSAFYVPAELLKADSEVIQGVWDTKTYTGVPIVGSESTHDLQVRKLSPNQLEVLELPREFQEREFLPVQMGLSQPEQMEVVQNWRSDLLPIRDIRLEVENAFLSKPIVIQARLVNIRPAAGR